MFKPERIRGGFAALEERLGRLPLLNAVRQGLILMTPLVLIGSIALIFLSLPLSGYQNWMDQVFGAQWRNFFLFIRDCTFNILALLMALCTGYSYAVENGERLGNNVSPIMVASVSLCSFVALLGIGDAGFAVNSFGVVGIFLALAAAVSSAQLFMKLGTVKVLKIKAFTDGADSTFNYAITSIYPAAITIAIFALINQAFSVFLGIVDLQKFISNGLIGMFAQIHSLFWSCFLFVGLVHLFWFFGMHGSNILEPVAQKLFVPGQVVNLHLNGTGPVQSIFVNKTFLDTFILMGGCGTALCLISAILIAGKYKNQKRLAKLSLIPVLFNINELLVFGIPLVLNPVYALPFLCVPILLLITSYWAIHWGWVPYTRHLVEWTTPIFLSGYTATGSIKGSLLQLFNLILGTVVYIPFVKTAELVFGIRMKHNLEKLYELHRQNEERGLPSAFLTRRDDIGNIARFLTADLHHDLKNDKIALFYQPQVDSEGTVCGAEALLRWKHDSYGYIAPPLVIALAEEAQLIDELGFWILDTACQDLAKIEKMGFPNLTVSVNVSAVQLENDDFIEILEKTILKHQVQPQNLQVEITEQLALSKSQKLIGHIMGIKKLGVKLAMDDFGMGHSSLMYLKEYNFDMVKLDGSLVREILSNPNCQNIIASIIYLGKSLNYMVLAEFVEVEAQKNLLHELGCNHYQGYLYSKALPYRELIEYILSARGSVALEEERTIVFT